MKELDLLEHVTWPDPLDQVLENLSGPVGEENHRHSGYRQDQISPRTEEDQVEGKQGQRYGEVPLVGDERHQRIEETVLQIYSDEVKSGDVPLSDSVEPRCNEHGRLLGLGALVRVGVTDEEHNAPQPAAASRGGEPEQGEGGGTGR